MAVPKKRTTKSHQGDRRSHHALKIMHFSHCTKCGKEVLPHRLCENCGNYNGREVVNVLAKLDKKERKRREKEQAAHEKEQGEKSSAAQGSDNLEELSKK
jgi:large subunit ribosomal protein L32